MVSNVNGQIKFEDGDLGQGHIYQKSQKSEKNLKKFKYAYFWISFMPSDSLNHYRHYYAKFVYFLQETKPKNKW